MATGAWSSAKWLEWWIFLKTFLFGKSTLTSEWTVQLNSKIGGSWWKSFNRTQTSLFSSFLPGLVVWVSTWLPQTLLSSTTMIGTPQWTPKLRIELTESARRRKYTFIGWSLSPLWRSGFFSEPVRRSPCSPPFTGLIWRLIHLVLGTL